MNELKPKGPFDCEVEGCTEPAQHFPPCKELRPDGRVEHKHHRFCDAHLRAHEATRPDTVEEKP